MEFTTELLLSHTPEDAIVMMVNEENGTRFPSGLFEISEPVALDGRRTQVRLTVRRSYHKEDEVPLPAGSSFDFVYNRLDLADHFQDVLTGFEIPLPTSTQVVLDELTRRLEQKFFLDDIVLEEIGRNNAAPYRLKAKVESLRWIGELEVWLAEYADLHAFFTSAILSNSGPRLGSLSNKPQLRSLDTAAPFTNATPRKDLIARLVEGNYAQDQTSLVSFVNAVQARPGQPLGGTPWTLSSTPSPYNLFNARMLAAPSSDLYASKVNVALNHSVEITLDPAYCTNLDDVTFKLPYRSDDFSTSTFTAQPRLTRYGVHSLTNGTAYANYLNGLTPGTTLKTLAGTGGHFNILPGPSFICLPTVPGPRNLYNAVVVYNGQRRSVDNLPADPTLNRVLVLALSNWNTAYSGNFEIHYRAPIVLAAEIPDAKLQIEYLAELNPTGGIAPYTVALAPGSTLMPGHSLSPSGTITGKSTAQGVHTFSVDVTDANNTKVRYTYTYACAAGPLLVSGNAPDAAVGTSYNFQYQIEGGVGPYEVLLDTGNFPPGVNIDETARLTGTITNTAQQTFTWSISVKDATDTVIYRSDSIDIIPGV